MPLGPVLRSVLGSALSPALGEGVGGFSLDAYLASLSDGYYFDTTKLDRFFQESIGPTLADDVGEAMGLALDQRTWGGQTLAQVAAAQPELVANGGFDTDLTGWSAAASSAPSTVVWSAGAAVTQTDGIANARLRSIITTVVGKTYRVYSTGTLGLQVGTTAGASDISGGAYGAFSGTYRYFTAVGTTTHLSIISATNGLTLDNVSVKEVPGNHALQATGTLKPVRQTAGAKFDGSDDNWLSPYLNASGNNFVVALLTVPASLAAAQYFVGAYDATPNRFRLGFTTAGLLTGAIGSDASTLIGTTDRRGQTLVVGMSCDGTTMRLFEDNAEIVTAAQAGVPTTSVAHRIGAYNNAGTATGFFGDAVKRIVAGRDALTLARYQQIRSALLAA